MAATGEMLALDCQHPRIVGYTTRNDWLPTPVQRAFIDRLVTNSRRLTTTMKDFIPHT